MSEVRDILNPSPDNDNTDNNTAPNNTMGIIQVGAIIALIVVVLWTNRDNTPAPGPGPDPTPNTLELDVSTGVRDFIVQYNDNLSEATGLLAEKLKDQEFKDTDEFRVLARKYTEEARVEATNKTIDAVMDKYVEPGELAGRETGEVLRQVLEVQSRTHKEIADTLQR